MPKDQQNSLIDEEEKTYKKFYRKSDQHLNGQIEAKHGKQAHQKIKPYVVLQYLMKSSDEDTTKSANDIVEALAEYGIPAERRSIYRDIEEINKVFVMLENDCTIEEAEEMLAEDEDLKIIVYDEHKKGFYARRPNVNIDDLRLLAECVYSSKFISEKTSNALIDFICETVSEPQADTIKHEAFLVDRIKTNNTQIIRNIMTIDRAMRRNENHKPEKISFHYLKYTIANVRQQVERRKGERYIVSPYHLLINDGNYYLLAFDDKSQKMKTYRVDRMKDICLIGEPRAGEEDFKKIDLKNYAQQHFSMFSGKTDYVTIQAINPLLDTMIDRFGNERYGAIYSKGDKDHFNIRVKIEVSEQFYGWLLGFGKRVKLIAPDDVVEDFKAYLDKIKSMY